MEEDNKVVEENISCTEFSLGSFELKEQGRLLDIERSFNIGLGMFSVPTFLKLVFWGLSLYTLVIDIIAHVHQDFYLAFVTSWTLIHSIVYLTGSVLLTIFPFPSVPTEGKNRLIKFVWLYQSLVLVHGSFATVIYWSMYWVPEKGLGFMGSTIWTHGGVLLLCLLNGLVVDRTPIRLKHISINIIWGVLYLLWAILQNTAIQYVSSLLILLLSSFCLRQFSHPSQSIV